MSKTHVVSASTLVIDQFIVHSIMFIQGYNLFAVSVDNYGIIVLDILSASIVDSFSFKRMVPELPSKFTIMGIVPINNNGIR